MRILGIGILFSTESTEPTDANPDVAYVERGSFVLYADCFWQVMERFVDRLWLVRGDGSTVVVEQSAVLLP